MLPWHLKFQSNQPKNLKQPFSSLIMLYMKFDENWSTDLRDTVYYFERVDGQ